jgi:energy-coupling factor transport system permease protein
VTNVERDAVAIAPRGVRPRRVGTSAWHRYLLPRTIHPGAWWMWALGLAVAASRTTNLLVDALIVAVVALVVLARRGDAPWALNFRMYVWVALLIVVVRVAFRVVFAAGGSPVLFTIPSPPLPGPFAGLVLFGRVSAQSLVSGLQSGAQLAVMVLCVGAANALANPKRLLAAVPGALYEFGTVVVITLSVFPQLAESVRRVTRARQLRGGGRGLRHALREVVMPVLADALDRSLALASAMDSRGYGRQAHVPVRARRWTAATMILALIGFVIGLYGLLNTAAGAAWMTASIGLPGVTVSRVMLVVGLVLAGVSLKLAGRRAVRTRYRPDPWRGAEWVVLACGVVAAVTLTWAATADPVSAYPAASAWPQLTMPMLIGLVVGVLPAVLAPAAVAESTAVAPAVPPAQGRGTDSSGRRP